MKSRTLSSSFALLVVAIVAPVMTLAAGKTVRFDSAGEVPGTIVVSNKNKELYRIVDANTAVKYPVAVGRLPSKGKAGTVWQGETYVDGKHVKPAWSPPADMKAQNPRLPDVIPGGAPNNPMGTHALTLAGDEYAIHGTNDPSSIGRNASAGCIRMYNQDIAELYDFITVGTKVVVKK